MALEVSGTVVSHLPAKTGQSAKGPWISRSFVLQPPGQYDKPFPVDFYGDKGDVLDSIAVGEEVTVHFNIKGREYNGNWYSSISAWKIDVVNGGSKPLANGAGLPEKASVLQAFAPTEEENFDLPF